MPYLLILINNRTFASENTPEFFKDINVLTDEERNIRRHRIAEVK